MTKSEALRAALLARGERRIEDPKLSKFEKWTYHWRIRRDASGNLVPMEKAVGQYPYYLFLSRRGYTIRVGTKATVTRHMPQELIDALAAEGGKYNKHAADDEVLSILGVE